MGAERPGVQGCRVLRLYAKARGPRRARSYDSAAHRRLTSGPVESDLPGVLNQLHVTRHARIVRQGAEEECGVPTSDTSRPSSSRKSCARASARRPTSTYPKE